MSVSISAAVGHEDVQAYRRFLDSSYSRHRRLHARVDEPGASEKFAVPPSSLSPRDPARVSRSALEVGNFQQIAS